ncbi:hypothetical protein HYH03_009093 [Edaphochlamys debaryana]|uniref:Uncharacterized protein n=1 Tax=Edaphochlamys debaryana TaxID=47281 RepID=A0A835XYN2_9CHLO|nr:hypothetical protein HYH03_009093 [Edaphochlamys debaryana]|eukprot:KAG2492678.1 hypothetical protein HYH03_009093 [Edaphochlamys debaryana]
MQVARAFTAVRPVRSVAAPATQRMVVVQAKPTKLADFAGLSDAELVNKANDLKRELTSTKWLQRTRGVSEFKPGENQPQPDPEKVPKGNLNKHLRRQIAQCLTLVRQRQMAEGIDRRTARKIEKRAALANGILQKGAKAKVLAK